MERGERVATKGRPFTVRFSPEVERRLEEEARRARRPKTVMLEALADEALRMRRFPGVGFVGPEHDRRAYLLGTGLEVWEVVELYRDYGEEGRKPMLEAHPITERQLEVALAYHREYPEEIDWHVWENDRAPDEWHRMYPGVIPPPAEDTAT
jgi:uncharacterized protein (DUF433 family)